MNSAICTPYSLPTWSAMAVRAQVFVLVPHFVKGNRRHLPQGCFPLTD